MERWRADPGDQAAQGSDFWEKGEEREASPEAASAYGRASGPQRGGSAAVLRHGTRVAGEYVNNFLVVKLPI